MINIYALVVIFGWITLVIATSIFSKKRFPKKSELSRKIVHIGTGPIVPMAWWLGIPANLAITSSILITISLIINYQIRLIPAVEDIKRNSYGTIAYGISITLLLFLFWPEKADAVSAAVLVMAFADGFAGLLGKQMKSPNWKVFGHRKSIAGTLTMTLVSMAVLIAMVFLSGAPLNPVRIISVACLAATLEQVSGWGIDNFTVPCGVAFAWQWMTIT